MSRTYYSESRGVWDTLLIVAVAALTVMFAQAQRAAAEEEVQEGRIVDLSADGGDDVQADVDEQTDVQQEPEQPVYWLGLQGGPIDSELLRTHLQLADGVGVYVQGVVPDSPAAKAGLQKHDVLLEVNGEQIADMTVLQKAVSEGAGKPLELKLIRLAKEMTITVTPEERPADFAQDLPQMRMRAPGDMPFEHLQDLLRQFPQGNAARGMRMIGPGMIGGMNLDLGQLPGGVSIAITREGEGPATITVKKDGKEWTVKGDDEEAIKELPEDVRPFVEQMLNGQRGAVNFRNLHGLLPDNLGNFEFDFDVEGLQDAARARAGDAVQRAEDASERLMERMEQLEKQLDELRQQLHEEKPAEGANNSADPSNT